MSKYLLFALTICVALLMRCAQPTAGGGTHTGNPDVSALAALIGDAIENDTLRSPGVFVSGGLASLVPDSLQRYYRPLGGFAKLLNAAQPDTIVTVDTTITIDTLHLIDSTLIADTLYVRDTVINNQRVNDTSSIEGPAGPVQVITQRWLVDTLLISDTLVAFDTIIAHKQLIQTDTFFVVTTTIITPEGQSQSDVGISGGGEHSAEPFITSRNQIEQSSGYVITRDATGNPVYVISNTRSGAIDTKALLPQNYTRIQLEQIAQIKRTAAKFEELITLSAFAAGTQEQEHLFYERFQGQTRLASLELLGGKDKKLSTPADNQLFAMDISLGQSTGCGGWYRYRSLADSAAVEFVQSCGEQGAMKRQLKAILSGGINPELRSLTLDVSPQAGSIKRLVCNGWQNQRGVLTIEGYFRQQDGIYLIEADYVSGTLQGAITLPDNTTITIE